MVQHYFRSKDEMLLFALDQCATGSPGRLQARLGSLTGAGPRDIIRAVLTELLPVDQDSRAEAIISVAYYSRAAVTPAYATALRNGLATLLDIITEQLCIAQHSGHTRPGLMPGRRPRPCSGLPTAWSDRFSSASAHLRPPSHCSTTISTGHSPERTLQASLAGTVSQNRSRRPRPWRFHLCLWPRAARGAQTL